MQSIALSLFEVVVIAVMGGLSVVGLPLFAWGSASSAGGWSQSRAHQVVETSSEALLTVCAVADGRPSLECPIHKEVIGKTLDLAESIVPLAVGILTIPTSLQGETNHTV